MDFISHPFRVLTIGSTIWLGWYESGEEEDITYIGAEEIGNAGIDGPFLVRFARVDFYLSETITANVATDLDVLTTEPYLANQFQTFPIIPLSAPILAQPANEDGDGAYTVNWSPPISQTVTYKLNERRVTIGSPGTFTESIIYSGTDTSVAVAGRTGGYIYCYSVRAIRNLRSSSWSDEACVTIAAPPPSGGGGSLGGG